MLLNVIRTDLPGRWLGNLISGGWGVGISPVLFRHWSARRKESDGLLFAMENSKSGPLTRTNSGNAIGRRNSGEGERGLCR